jgi:hypothetical protein
MEWSQSNIPVRIVTHLPQRRIGMDLTQSLVVLVAGLAVAVFIFAAIREIVLWYFKINEAVDTLKRIESLLSQQQQPAPPPSLPSMAQTQAQRPTRNLAP